MSLVSFTIKKAIEEPFDNVEAVCSCGSILKLVKEDYSMCSGCGLVYVFNPEAGFNFKKS